MVSPDDKRVVSPDPATEMHLLPAQDLSRERKLPRRVPEYGFARQVRTQMDILRRIPPAVHPAAARVRFIDQIKKAIHPLPAIHPVRAIHPPQPILASRPKQLSASELHQLYSGTSVPAHRYLSGLLSAAVNSPEIAPDPAKWFTGIAEFNLSEVVAAWLNTNGSTEYERLDSIGLDANSSRLTGVLTVRQRSGYAGGPLTAGSREFVAFWVDWGSGFQYEGTTSVAVHDFSSLPAAGLEYVVFLPLRVLAHVQPGGKDAGSVKVKAVLSWNTPTSTTDPCAPVVWGNSLDDVILIPPGINVSSGAVSSLKYAPAGFCLRRMS